MTPSLLPTFYYTSVKNSTIFIKYMEYLTLQNPLGKEGFDIRINTAAYLYPTPSHFTRFEVFRLATKKVSVFFDALLCSLIGKIRHFGGFCFSSSGFLLDYETSHLRTRYFSKAYLVLIAINKIKITTESLHVT
jgi:hypothetical protein